MNETKVCSKCKVELPLHRFRLRKDTGKPRNECRDCESARYRGEDKKPMITQVSPVVSPVNPKDAKEAAMKRMLSSAKQRALAKGLMFDIHYDDIQIPNLCPVLKIPLIPSVDGQYSDNSPSLDRKIPYLGYTKGNVQVISMRANRLKSDANSAEIAAVLAYVQKIEEENV